jgi:hypothetical protein
MRDEKLRQNFSRILECKISLLETEAYMGDNIKMHLIRRQFEKFVDWRRCAAVMQREAVNLMPNCSGGGNVVVA